MQARGGFLEASFDMWLEYILRFSHLVAGIAWIGSSFYFIWLDSSFLPPETPRKNVDGELFMVHGGFYYQVDKKKIYPGELPKILHWFKWEATLTVISGYLLFIVLYFMKGASLLIDPRIKTLSQFEAISMSLGFIILSWIIYDLIWNDRIVKSKKISTFLSVIFFSGLIYLSTQTFSGRGAFIIVGGILATMMVLNVWIRILPGQAKMLKEAQAGQVPDYSVSLKAKTRSVHNTYFTFPVLFMMLSNHYATLYNHPHNWLLLIVLSVSGALVRHAMVTKNTVERWTLLPATIGIGILIYMTAAPPAVVTTNEKVTWGQVKPVIEARCTQCHSAQNTDDVFKVPQKGLIFDSEAAVLAVKDKIYEQVLVARVMPFINKTNMTEEERALLGRWLKQ
jgi:uncharacterized membrane protein